VRLSQPRFELFHPELAQSHRAVIADLEYYAYFIETAARRNRSHYLERSSGARGVLGAGNDNDNVRAQAREIALGVRAIFGTFLYKTVATVMSVALDLKIRESSVRDWCGDLPPANKVPV
jgi:hypothetical protein